MDDVPVTLREATESGLVPATLEALRSAALRDKDFPHPVVAPRGIRLAGGLHEGDIELHFPTVVRYGDVRVDWLGT